MVVEVINVEDQGVRVRTNKQPSNKRWKILVTKEEQQRLDGEAAVQELEQQLRMLSDTDKRHMRGRGQFNVAYEGLKPQQKASQSTSARTNACTARTKCARIPGHTVRS